MESDMSKATRLVQEVFETQYGGQPGKRLPIDKLFYKMGKATGAYRLPNLAVEICWNSYEREMTEVRKQKCSPEFLVAAGKIAYCVALPHFTDRDSIRDFIACIVYGMAVNAIPSTEGTRLLYGAQVAYSALPARKRYKKRDKSTQNTPGNQPVTLNPSVT